MPACSSTAATLVAAVGVPVVVAEHREHRHVDAGDGLGQDRRLLGLAVGREVAGQQHEVDAAGQPGERRGGSLGVAVAAEVHVAGGRDPDPAVVLRARGASGGVDRHARAGTPASMAPDEQPFSAIEHALKRAAAALREADVPFLLGGSLASWARGGPETRHDLDLVIKPEDAERAVQALVDAGMKAEDPPEEWLVKAWDGDTLVDLIFGPKGLPVTDEVIARGEELAVLGMDMRVMALEDVLTTKLMALTEHSLRYEGLLRIARALREQVDWDEVRSRTAESPFARAFFVLLEGLDILPGGAAPARETRVRVVTPQGSGARTTGVARPHGCHHDHPRAACAAWPRSGPSAGACSPSSSTSTRPSSPPRPPAPRR